MSQCDRVKTSRIDCCLHDFCLCRRLLRFISSFYVFFLALFWQFPACDLSFVLVASVHFLDFKENMFIRLIFFALHDLIPECTSPGKINVKSFLSDDQRLFVRETGIL